MTGREIYEQALSLINERDSEGNFHTDTSDFEHNAPDLITLAVSDLWYLDGVIRGIPPRDFRYTVKRITSLEDEIPLHPSVAATIPYFLASMLLNEEDGERSDYFRKMFLSAKLNISEAFTKAEHKSIRDVYSSGGM
ncbi:MAG: hypothetical protein IKW68_00695 [Clostridia bacterium]|nr:hypothetical protein [Clostridia bacterium]